MWITEYKMLSSSALSKNRKNGKPHTQNTSTETYCPGVHSTFLYRIWKWTVIQRHDRHRQDKAFQNKILLMWNQSWLRAELGKLTLYILGFLSVSDLWKDESSGIYDVMFKSETSLVIHRISFFIGSLQQAQPIWQVWLDYLKRYSELFLRRTCLVKIFSHK